jgi:hypothetical protein
VVVRKSRGWSTFLCFIAFLCDNFLLCASMVLKNKNESNYGKIACTVKPVYNGHPWDPKIVAVVHMWLLLRGFQSKLLFLLNLI